MDISP